MSIKQKLSFFLYILRKQKRRKFCIMKALISQGSKSCPFLAVLHTRYIEYFADKIFSLSLIRSLSTECNLPKFTFEISAEFAEI